VAAESGQSGMRARWALARASEPSFSGRIRRLLRFIWALTVETTRVCLKYRVTGLAAEAGFFALLSLPPLVLGLVGAIGFVGEQLGETVVADLRQQLRALTLTFLTADSVSSVILPTFDQVLSGGRADIVSIGFVFSLWSGSRALNVYVDTISIMYGLGGFRGIIRTRALSLSLYALALVAGIVIIPVVLLGPGLLGRLLQEADLDLLARLSGSQFLYWPTVSIAAVAALCTLYHIATPIRSPWRRDLPGAVLALVIWVVASFVLRWTIGESVGGASIYGPLATPIVVLIWLYFLAIAVLIGAALNAAIDERYPTEKRLRAKAAAAARDDEGPGTAPAHDDDDGRPVAEAPEPNHADPEAVRPELPAPEPRTPGTPETGPHEAPPRNSRGHDNRAPELPEPVPSLLPPPFPAGKPLVPEQLEREQP
jgi:membrane protein